MVKGNPVPKYDQISQKENLEAEKLNLINGISVNVILIKFGDVDNYHNLDFEIFLDSKLQHA